MPKEEADYWLKNGHAAKHLWLCKYCGAKHESLECPYKCSNENCDNTREDAGFELIHPVQHYEMSDCIEDNFHFLTVEESRTTDGIGKIYSYNDSFYREENSIGFIKRLIKGAAPRKKNTYRNEVCHDIADMTQVSQDSLGLNGPRVAVENGILNLETLEMEDFNPEEYALNKIPHEYNPNAECPLFEEKLGEWIPDERNRKRLQELLGTALHSEKLHKKMGILLGPTDAGKSTLLKIVRFVFGKDNVEGQTPHNLGERWGPDKIFGVLLNAADELSATELKRLDKLKAIGDGNPIVAEQKGEKTYTFEPTCEHIFGANIAPDADRSDEAFFNRIIPLEFPDRIYEDKQNLDLFEELKKEAQGILNWIVEGYRSFSENGNKFTYSISPEEARTIWFNWSSAIQRFIQKQVEQGTETDKIHSKDLYDKIKTFADEEDIPKPPKSQREVTKEFKKLPYVKHGNVTVNGSRKKGFRNVRVAYSEEPKKELECQIKNIYENSGFNSSSSVDRFLEHLEIKSEITADRRELKETVKKMKKRGDISLADIEELGEVDSESDMQNANGGDMNV